MKYFTHLLPLAALLCTAAPCAAQADEATVSFFAARLVNPDTTAPAPADKRLQLPALDAARRTVWHSWTEANRRHAETGLPALQPMDKAAPQQWPLIAEEPLPFYYISKGERPEAGYPLFLNLHGSGDRDAEWAVFRQLSVIYDDAPSVYFIPQIPSMQRYRWWYVPEQQAWEKLLRLAMVSGDIDPLRIYFTGISEGGYGSQRLGAFYADYLAGVGPMAGGEPLDNAPPANFRHTPFAFETGADDHTFGRRDLTTLAKTVFENLSQASPGDYAHRIRLQQGRGHSIVYTHVTPWLKQHRRRPHPKTVSWVNFALHGRYRTGFYNLAVLEAFNVSPDSSCNRTVFHLEIAGNTITLTGNTFDTDTRELGAITKGKLMVYLSPELVDLAAPVTLVVNGRTRFSGTVPLQQKHLLQSCLTFFDPLRLYPAGIEVDFSENL